MSFLSVIKLLAALAVLGVMVFAGLLAWHVTVRPVGGVFEKVVPAPGELAGAPPEKEITKVLEAKEMPDLEPGEKAFQKANELVAMGDLAGAREKLNTIVTIYPGSSCASSARHILGEMNLDDLLSADHREGKVSYMVQKGDSFVGIANKQQTTVDCLMHVNGLLELSGLQPREELLVLPLRFRLVIEPKARSLSLWDGGNFVKEYGIRRLEVPATLQAGHTVIDTKFATFGGKRLTPGMKGYRESEKTISLARIGLPVRSLPSEGAGVLPKGVYLAPEDMEELWLVTRAGNEVEIRLPVR